MGTKRGRSNEHAFAALFPPLLAGAPGTDMHHMRDDGDVDIGVDDILLPPLEKAVDASIYRALQRWNEFEPVKVESALGYMERLKKYRAIVSGMLYQNDDGYDDDLGDGEEVVGASDTNADVSANADADGATENASARRKRKLAETMMRKEKKTRKRERAKRRQQFEKLWQIFHSLPAVDTLRAERIPSERLQQFTNTYTAKKRTLLQKRSVGDTRTSMSFAFARRAPSRFPHAKAGEDDHDDEEEGDDGEGEEHKKTSQDASVHRNPTRMLRDQNLLMTRDADIAAARNAESAAAKANTDELIIWLDVLHPSKDPAKTQSFLVRDSQTLSDVVDLIVCAFDQRLGDHDRHSKMVFFDGRFYVDRRNPENLDYADPIRAWIRKSATRIARYGDPGEKTTSLAMEATRFRDLSLNIDMPGLYLHQGECEHLIRIRDARLPHEHDAKLDTDPEAFPMRLPNAHHRALRNCFVCQQYSAKFICYGDRMGISDPMFFCDRCYRVAHFDSAGKLVYKDFQAFPYIQD